MKIQNIYNDLINKLRTTIPKYFDKEGNLLKQLIAEKGLELNPELLEVILKDDNLKYHFTQEIAGVTVFDKEIFLKSINDNYIIDKSTVKGKERLIEIINKTELFDYELLGTPFYNSDKESKYHYEDNI